MTSALHQKRKAFFAGAGAAGVAAGDMDAALADLQKLRIADLRLLEPAQKSSNANNSSTGPAPLTPLTPSTPLVHLHEAQVFQPPDHPRQALIDGEVWPPIFRAEQVRSAKLLQPLEGDVFVCTYPKCGTTWVQHICAQLLLDNAYGPAEGKELSQTSPMIEKVGAAFVAKLPQPRLLKTHFTYANCPKSPQAKYIFVCRNPKDCLTSYYFHNRNFKIYDFASGDFDVFFELFASGQLAFGDYYDHLLSWLPHMYDENVLFLRYEDMYEDLEEAVQKIGAFLGGRAADRVLDPEVLRRIVEESGIASMKKDQGRWFPGQHLSADFIRKGGSRDWKSYMTKEQSDRIDAITLTRLAGTEAAFWWRQELAWDLAPEIVVTSDDEEEVEEDAEAYNSVSRRCSCLLSPLHVPFLPERRNSLDSIASSGYGSVWSVPT